VDGIDGNPQSMGSLPSLLYFDVATKEATRTRLPVNGGNAVGMTMATLSTAAGRTGSRDVLLVSTYTGALHRFGLDARGGKLTLEASMQTPTSCTQGSGFYSFTMALTALAPGDCAMK